MTYDQLRAAYTVAYRIILRERDRRDAEFAAGDQQRMADLDKLLEVIDSFKDELKKHIQPVEQPKLLDVARKVAY